MNRKLCQISEEIGDLLVKQAAHELKNFILYTSFANYFSLEGLVSLEKYYYKRAFEEKNHHDWVISYLNDADFSLKYPIIPVNAEQEISSIVFPFTATVAREIETTQLIYHIYETALTQKDFMTASWLLEKLIKEQIEEESISRMAAQIIESEGDIFIKSERILDLLS